MGIKLDGGIGLERPGTLKRALTRTGAATLLGLGLAFGAFQNALATMVPPGLVIGTFLDVVLMAPGAAGPDYIGEVEEESGAMNAISTLFAYSDGDPDGRLAGTPYIGALTHLGNSVRSSGSATGTGALGSDANNFDIFVEASLAISNTTGDDFTVTVKLDYDHDVSAFGLDSSAASMQCWDAPFPCALEAAVAAPLGGGAGLSAAEDGSMEVDIVVVAGDIVSFFSDYSFVATLPTGSFSADWDMIATLVKITNDDTGGVFLPLPPPTINVSEPATLLLLGGSLLGIGFVRRRKLAQVVV